MGLPSSNPLPPTSPPALSADSIPHLYVFLLKNLRRPPACGVVWCPWCDYGMLLSLTLSLCSGFFESSGALRPAHGGIVGSGYLSCSVRRRATTRHAANACCRTLRRTMHVLAGVQSKQEHDVLFLLNFSLTSRTRTLCTYVNYFCCIYASCCPSAMDIEERIEIRADLIYTGILDAVERLKNQSVDVFMEKVKRARSTD